jgi:hypothetical protein
MRGRTRTLRVLLYNLAGWRYIMKALIWNLFPLTLSKVRPLVKCEPQQVLCTLVTQPMALSSILDRRGVGYMI